MIFVLYMKRVVLATVILDLDNYLVVLDPSYRKIIRDLKLTPDLVRDYLFLKYLDVYDYLLKYVQYKKLKYDYKNRLAAQIFNFISGMNLQISDLRLNKLALLFIEFMKHNNSKQKQSNNKITGINLSKKKNNN